MSCFDCVHACAAQPPAVLGRVGLESLGSQVACGGNHVFVQDSKKIKERLEGELEVVAFVSQRTGKRRDAGGEVEMWPGGSEMEFTGQTFDCVYSLSVCLLG